LFANDAVATKAELILLNVMLALFVVMDAPERLIVDRAKADQLPQPARRWQDCSVVERWAVK
jgi:hypothetical protein